MIAENTFYSRRTLKGCDPDAIVSLPFRGVVSLIKSVMYLLFKKVQLFIFYQIH